jgi:hypothetical protein
MSSIIKVNTYQDANGNALFSSDGSGNVTTSATGLQNTPAFHVHLSSNQGGVNNTFVKVQFDTELYDTNNNYDNSTNYRFTPTVAGKYWIYATITSDTNAVSNIEYVTTALYKNGSQYSITQLDFRNNNVSYNESCTNAQVIDFNGSTDYVEAYYRLRTASGGGITFKGGTGKETFFGGYRIIGA